MSNEYRKDSYIEQRDWLLKTIGESFTKNTVSKKINKKISNWSEINVTVDEPLCKSCLELYLGEINGEKICIDASGKPLDPKSKECAQKIAAFLNPIRDGVCSGLCTAKIGNIDMNQDIIVDSTANINALEIDVNKISEDIETEYKKRYGSVPNESGSFSENIKKLVTQISNSAVSNINQIISSSQSINTTGAGVEIKDISMDVSINAVMSAVINNSEAFSMLDKIVQEQIDIIRKEVDERMTGGLKKALTEGKSVLIGIGIFLLTLMLLISGLLIYRAYGLK